jgi:crossover junction endodeoxyribonuclease RusA
MITLPWPPSVNRLYRKWGGHMVLAPAARAYKKSVRLRLLGHIKPTTGRVDLTVRLFPPDKRRRDIDNILKCLLDALQGSIYENDSQVWHLDLTRREPARPGRVEIAWAIGE